MSENPIDDLSFFPPLLSKTGSHCWQLVRAHDCVNGKAACFVFIRCHAREETEMEAVSGGLSHAAHVPPSVFFNLCNFFCPPLIPQHHPRKIISVLLSQTSFLSLLLHSTIWGWCLINACIHCPRKLEILLIHGTVPSWASCLVSPNGKGYWKALACLI